MRLLSALLQLLPMPRVILDDGCQLVQDSGRAHRIARMLASRWTAIRRSHKRGATVEAIARQYALQLVPERCRNSDASGLIEHALIVEINRGINDKINPFELPTQGLLSALGSN